MLPFNIMDNWELTVLGKGHVSIRALSSYLLRSKQCSLNSPNKSESKSSLDVLILSFHIIVFIYTFLRLFIPCSIHLLCYFLNLYFKVLSTTSTIL